MIQVNFWHVLMHGPILIYIGLNKQNTDEFAFNALTTLALSLPFVIRLKNIDKSRIFINYYHLLFTMPFLIYLGVAGKKMPNVMFTISLILGIMLILIHLSLIIYKIYRNYKDTQKLKKSKSLPKPIHNHDHKKSS